MTGDGSMSIGDTPRPRPDLQVPAPWLATSAQEVRAFDSVDEALAAITQPPDVAGYDDRGGVHSADLDALAAA